MNKENEIIEKMIKKYNLDLGNDYIYVGATIIKRSDFPQSTEIFYCEDGFNDEEGIPYIMQSIVPKGIFNRDRMIVFYTKNLQRYVIPIDGENFTLIGNDIPENVKNINYGKAKKIVHRKALELKKEPKKLSKEDTDNLYEKYIKHYKKGRLLLAGILISIIWLFAIFFSMGNIFIKTGYINDFFTMAVLIGGAILSIIGIIFIIRFFIKIPARRLKSFAYKSDFLVMNYKKDINIKGLNESYIYGLTYDEENYKLMSYGIPPCDVAFIENVEYFEIVSRYSKNRNPKNSDICLFMRKEK